MFPSTFSQIVEIALPNKKLRRRRETMLSEGTAIVLATPRWSLVWVAVRTTQKNRGCRPGEPTTRMTLRSQRRCHCEGAHYTLVTRSCPVTTPLPGARQSAPGGGPRRRRSSTHRPSASLSERLVEPEQGRTSVARARAKISVLTARTVKAGWASLPNLYRTHKYPVAAGNIVQHA